MERKKGVQLLAARAGRGHARRVAWAATCFSSALAAVTCGGTTGREGLSEPVDSTGDASSAEAEDSTVETPSFDVGITYVDRLLPDVTAPSDAGAEVGYPWPQCPAFIPVGPDGGPVPLGAEVNQIPADPSADGGEVAAVDGSPCATYGWLGSTAVDNCLTSQASGGFGAGDFPFLPPCTWCLEAGAASQGPGAGVSAYTLCVNLYLCASRTGCGAANNPATCLCGDASAADCIVEAGGPCAGEELAALQATPADIQSALTNYTQFDPQYEGYCGSALNFVYQNARTNGCFQLADGAVNP